jgi:ABC-type glutathione transport system ATPase component
MSGGEVLLRVEHLEKTYPGHNGRPPHKALDDVSLELRAGETLGIVGESGSGKSTLARVLMRLTGADGGRVTYGGVDLLNARGADALFLTRQIQIVFQDPNSSMNPRRTVRQALVEAARVAGDAPADMQAILGRMMEAVGLSRDKLDAYPHQLSGGQRQRVAIARALAVSPKIVVADECVSALDVSVQSSILNLLLERQRELGLALLFISHDLAVVHHMSDRMIVMKSGRIVEAGNPAEIMRNPADPYTRELIASVPGSGFRTM